MKRLTVVGGGISGLAAATGARDRARERAQRDVLRSTIAIGEEAVKELMADRYPEAERLETVHSNKTGALIRCAARMGAIASGASSDELAAITTYGESIGLMFQAMDDLLDVTQSAEQMGKATGKDAEQGKLTYPGLLGVQGTRAEIQKLRQQAIDALVGFDAKADPLRELAHRLAQRDR